MYERLLRSAGFSPQISTYPGERSFQMLQRGEVDIEYTRTRIAVASIKDSVTLVGPVGCIEGVAFKRADSPLTIVSSANLQEYKVGVPYVHKTAVEFAAKNDLTVEVVNKRDSLFKMIDAGRLDVAVDALSSGLKAIIRVGLQGKIIQTGPILFSEPIYIVVTNRHPDWAARVQKALDMALHNGSWKRDIGEVNSASGVPKDLGLACLKN